MSYNSFAAPASPDGSAVFDAFERYGRMLEEMNITTAPDDEERLDNERADALWEWEWENTRDKLGEERCDLLCEWLETRRGAVRKADAKIEIDDKVEVATAHAGAASIAPDAKVYFTFFSNHTAASLTTEELTLTDIRERIMNASARTKDKLPWLKLAKFGTKRTDANSLRNDANVLEPMTATTRIFRATKTS